MVLLKDDEDFSTSPIKSFDEIDENWRDYPGLVIFGTHMPMSVEKKLMAIKEAREKNIPFLGICFGMQLAIIEYAHNVLGFTDANSTELSPETIHPVVVKMPNIRVGIKKVSWEGKDFLCSHWHNYKMNVDYIQYYRQGWDFSLTDGVVEVMRLRKHPFFLGIQGHPEYDSSKEQPHFLLSQFLNTCKAYAKS